MKRHAFKPSFSKPVTLLFSAVVSTAMLFTILIYLSMSPLTASAKTTESAKAENVFIYAKNADDKNVLLKVLPLDDLKKISHGQLLNLMSGGETGKNYYISSIDNYPTTQYCEARGITVPELISYVKSITTVRNAASIDFKGADRIRLMATDSYGIYNRTWTYDELYGVKRYYFEELMTSWEADWEISGEIDAKSGVASDDYAANFKNSDPHYEDKRRVFNSGKLTVPILATESFSGRTTADSLVASTEIGIADYIAKNGGKAAGSLKNALDDECSLRLTLPMTEADLMASHRTAFDNFKWTYNLLLEQAGLPAVASLGKVAQPVPSISVNRETMTITLTCPTAGATIYYSLDSAPQTLYSRPITVDISGRDLAANPMTFYITAVREGYDDEGIVTVKYPGLSPAFKPVFTTPIGEPLVLAAADSVSAEDWRAWVDALTFVTMKDPRSGGYARIDSTMLKTDSTARSVTLDASLISQSGSYSFIFHAAGYADKSISLTAKSGTPDIKPPKDAILGNDIIFTFSDPAFQNGLMLYVTPQNGDSTTSATSTTSTTGTMISSANLDRTQEGRLTIKAIYFTLQSCAIKTAGEYKFSLVNNSYNPGTIDVSVTLREGLPVKDYSDVGSSDWYFGAVRYVMSHGLLDDHIASGDFGDFDSSPASNAPDNSESSDNSMLFDNPDTSSATFGTAEPMTRAMLVTALHRLEGSPEAAAGADIDFSDVPDSAAYHAAVTWAASNKIVNGVGNGRFAPDSSITREQIATMLYRYSAYKEIGTSATQAAQPQASDAQQSMPGITSPASDAQSSLPSTEPQEVITNPMPKGDLSIFSDSDKISTWARDSLLWANGVKIINGMGNGTIAPQGTATRAQVAQMLLNMSVL